MLSFSLTTRHVTPLNNATNLNLCLPSIRLQERQQVLQNITNLSSQEVQDINAKQASDLISRVKETLETKGKLSEADLGTFLTTLKALQEEFKQIKCENNEEFNSALARVEQQIEETEKGMKNNYYFSRICHGSINNAELNSSRGIPCPLEGKAGVLRILVGPSECFHCG